MCVYPFKVSDGEVVMVMGVVVATLAPRISHSASRSTCLHRRDDQLPCPFWWQQVHLGSTFRAVVHHLHDIAHDSVIEMSRKTLARVEHGAVHHLELADVLVATRKDTEVDHHVCVSKWSATRSERCAERESPPLPPSPSPPHHHSP